MTIRKIGLLSNCILGFEFGIKDRCYERIVENNFTDPYTSKAESTMQKVVQNLLTKYQTKK